MPRNKTRNKTQNLSDLQQQDNSKYNYELIKWVAILVIACLIICTVSRFIWKHLYRDNRHFTFTTLKFVPTNNFTAENVIKRLADLNIEEHSITLPQIDLNRIRRSFKRDCIVKSVSLRRILPDTLEIIITEREPVAWLMGTPKHTITQDAIVLPASIKGVHLDMPLIICPKGTKALKDGEATDDKFLKSALNFIYLAKIRQEDYLLATRSIQVDTNSDNLILHLDQCGIFKDNAQIVLPIKQMNHALDRLEGIVREREACGDTISFVDVSFDKNIPVKP